MNRVQTHRLRIQFVPARWRSEIVLIFFILLFWNVTLQVFLLYIDSINSYLDICWNYFKYTLIDVMNYLHTVASNVVFSFLRTCFDRLFKVGISLSHVYTKQPCLKKHYLEHQEVVRGKVTDFVANGAYISVVKQDTNKSIKIA